MPCLAAPRLALRVLPVVALMALCAPAAPTAAQGGADPETIADRLDDEIVAVAPGMDDALPAAAAGEVRLRIAARAPDRVRVAVVTPEAAEAGGGVGGYANRLDAIAPSPGALVVTDGEDLHVVTSHPVAVVEPLRAALASVSGDDLRARLLTSVDVLAGLDPGRVADVGGPDGRGPAGGVTIAIPGGAWDTLRLVLWLVAAAVALPFLVLAAVVLLRVRAGRQRAVQDLAAAREAAQTRLVGVAEQVTALEADAGSHPAYATLVERYAAAESLLDRAAPDRRALADASRLLDEAEQAAAAARRGGTAAAAFGAT